MVANKKQYNAMRWICAILYWT